MMTRWFLLLVLGTGVLHAQSKPVDMRLAIGRPFPLGKFKSNEYGDTNPGFGAGMLVGVAITNNVSVGAEVSVFQMNDPRQSDEWGTILVPAMLNIRYKTGSYNNIHPYAVVGGGILHQAVTLPGEIDPRYGSFTLPMFSFGGGFQYPIASSAAVDFVVTYSMSPTNGKTATIEGEETRIAYGTSYVTFGLGLDFGL